TDGVWVAYQSIGNTGNVAAPYNLGRTLTHESGHYFGLRHTWGDGTCADDFCNDTPPAFEANYVTCGTPYPYVDPYGTCADNGDGEMYMAFMDYSNDSAMWMFTTDQVTRFHTALASSPWRSLLTASAINLGAGITQHNPLAENIAFFPNPSNGQINFAITLAAPTDLSVLVVNTLGQLVYSRTESNISHAVLSYDLSSLSKGVYFINIMDSQNNKTVKKMIIE
ncbi:MAG TPA: zinc-dependent metalloprotease, partial [Bacteroidia bacterium]